MFKRILTIIAIILAMSGLALAQTTLNATQSGASAVGAPHGVINWLNTSQAMVTGGGPLTINITQTSTTLWNDADLKQKGRQNLSTTVWQWATAQNVAITEQGTPSHPSDYAYDLNIDVHQTANGGDNYANIIQKYTAYKMRWNDFRVKQVAGTYNWAEMTGETDHSAISSHKLAVDQDAPTGHNIADLYVDYYNNTVVRADSTGTPEAFPLPATQTTSGGNNVLYVDQYGYYGHHKAGLYQSAAGDNNADIDQFGLYNTLGVYQIADTGGNILLAYQGGDATANNVVAKVVQDAATDNYANVYQNSPNKLVGADSDGTINAANPAKQISTDEYNELWTSQTGDYNEIGLYQSALGYNSADIDQTGGNNSLGVYMTNTNGYNSLTATQTGDSSATVVQSTWSGAGTINVSQN